MLKTLRKNTKVIIWTVILCFALWGGFSVGVSFKKEGRLAGEVFGKGVSFQEFDGFYRASQIFSFSDEPLDDPEAIKQHAWQSVIFSREALRRKIRVTDEEVRDEIKRLLAAQKIENPTPEEYRRWLSATLRETPQEFEGQVREILRIKKLIRSVDSEPVEPPTEEEARKKFLEENRTPPAEKKFEGEMKDKYLKELTDLKKRMRFLKWSLDLLESARLKDYMPRSETAASPPSRAKAVPQN